jgi:hypothetical protein
MVARAGAILRHIAPTHPAARRCGSLTLPHRRSAPANQQASRSGAEPRRHSAAEQMRQGSVRDQLNESGAVRPRAQPRSPRQAFGGETKARAD